jgi:hypothetical protein
MIEGPLAPAVMDGDAGPEREATRMETTTPVRKPGELEAMVRAPETGAAPARTARAIRASVTVQRSCSARG